LQDLSGLRRWNSIFALEIPSHQAESVDYILDRTQLRPRELLQFCKLCVEYYCEGKRIDECTILAAEEVFSEQKIKDLASEYRFQYPHLLDIFEVFRGRKSHFGKEELEYLLLATVCGELDVDRAANWVLEMDYLELKKLLWHIGFIKAKIPRPVGQSAPTKVVYLGHYELPTINLENVESFCIHPAFYSFLSLKH